MSRERDLVRHGRREAWITLAIWAVVTTYVVLYCYANGYDREPESLTFILGFPDWIFWGVIVPWFGCVMISVIMAVWVIADDPQVEASTADEEQPGARA